MKLPHHLLRTYRRYKEEEQNLLLWIESTARDCGHTFSNKKEKLKGRARTLACRADAIHQEDEIETLASRGTSQQNEATISILEILPPIAAIAKNPRISSIPIEVVNQFNTVLDLRTACLHWFRGNTAQDDKRTREDNEKHTFPVALIKKAISILKSKFPLGLLPSSKEKSSVETVPVVIQSMKNLFAQLPLEETGDEAPEILKEDNNHARDNAQDGLLKTTKLTNEEKLQDEFNIAKFCMLRDIHQIEDLMVLELVRYSLDQASADVLPFLSNTAIDIVAKMESLLYENFDWEKYERGFMETIVLPNEYVVHSSPQLRMQNAISTQRRKIQGVTGLTMFDTTDMEFDPNDPYFGACIEDQILVEQLFIESLLRIEQEGTWNNSIFYLDSLPTCIRASALPGISGENYYAIPAGPAFGVRIALLATLILKDNPLISYTLFQGTSLKHRRLEVSRLAFWKTPEYRSERVVALWPNIMQTMLDAQRISCKNYDTFTTKKKTALSMYHMICMLNHCHIRMRYATTSIAAMEVSNTVKILAHLWNLLREENHIDMTWPDMDFLLAVLGEDYLYSSTRPESIPGKPGAIRSRIMYGMGIVKKDLKKVTKSVGRYNFTEAKLRHNERYTLSCYPLYTQLLKRGECAVGTLDGAVDSELIVTASVIPEMIGRKPQPVVFNTDAQIENKHTLWKLRDQGPGLQSTELLAVVKKGLQKEFGILDFDYLKFEQVTTELVIKMTKSLKVVRDLPAAVATDASLFQKLQLVMFNIIENEPVKLLPEIAAMFKQWLPENGHIGVKGLHVHEQRPVNPRSQLSSLRPEVLNIVKSIMNQRGLREDVFSQDQLDVGSVVVTETFEGIIQAAWTNHKIHRKTTKLESGRCTHPGLKLS